MEHPATVMDSRAREMAVPDPLKVRLMDVMVRRAPVNPRRFPPCHSAQRLNFTGAGQTTTRWGSVRRRSRANAAGLNSGESPRSISSTPMMLLACATSAPVGLFREELADGAHILFAELLHLPEGVQ